MTAGRYRTPLRVPALALACASDARPGASSAPADLFPLDGAGHAPHPAFLERLEAFRRYGVEGLQRIAHQPMIRPMGHNTPPRNQPRHLRPAPRESRQYAPQMATTAARDDRLTPNAKAFLTVLRARCGKSRSTTITKGTAGSIMSRSPRTIRRYLVDLIRFGYVTTEVRRNGAGMHLGLVVTITDLVTPFFEETKGLARWLAETPAAVFRPFEAVVSSKQGVTLSTPKNQPSKNPSQKARETAWRVMRAERPVPS